MIIYTAIVSVLYLVGFGMMLQRNSIAGLLEIILLIPIVGRIFGWW